MPAIHSASVSFTSRAKSCRCVTSAINTSFRRGLSQRSSRCTKARVIVCSSMLRMGNLVCGMSSGRRNEPAGGGKQRPAPALLQPAPQALLEEDRDDDRDQYQAHQVPAAVVAERLVQRPEDQGTDDRPFDASDAAD